MKARARTGGGRLGREQGESHRKALVQFLFLPLMNAALRAICPIWFQL